MNSTFTIEEYVNEILLGEGVEAFNITYTGGASQLGYMTGGEDVFTIGSGLVLSSDAAVNIACEFGTCGDCLGTAFNDPDLLDIANSVPPLINQNFSVSSVNDGCVLEFDFTLPVTPSASTTFSVQTNMKRGSTPSTTMFSPFS